MTDSPQTAPLKLSILVVDDDAMTLKRLAQLLSRNGCEIRTASDGAEALGLIRENRFDIVLTDLMIDQVDGLDLLEQAKKRSPDTEVIIITGYASVDSAIDATKKGAFHYLQKPIRPDEVRHIVAQAAKKLKLSRRVRELEQEIEVEQAYGGIIGKSPRMIEIKKLIRHIEDSESNVLITGESGTGKELVARTIHDTSLKNRGRFVAFNCASFHEDLVANELFGHEKEAFTGASGVRPGLLESADKGTVFFDEIGDMPLSMQAKLLRVVQERELIRVGGTTPVSVDIRIIAATNRDLKELCAAGLFRQDLYFRLNVIHIHLPFLHERKEDIPLLASFFLNRHSRRMGKPLSGFTGEAMKLLCDYGYPGNIRELENIVEHAVAMARGRTIRVADLPADLAEYDAFTVHRPHSPIRTLEEVQADYIAWVLEKVGHRKAEAARLLGINRASLYRRLKRTMLDE
ncbi:sigma-54 dependent transcriptional regulator [Desulfatiferula olefinivorans]